MFFVGLIKLLLLLFFIYFIYNLFRIIFKVSSSLKKNTKDMNINNKENNNSKKNNSENSGKIIELDKDQYKVE